MLTWVIHEIRQKIADGKFEFSQHAVNQSIQRKISIHEFRELMDAGRIIEDYPGDKYGPSCLIFGMKKSGRPLHAQCSHPTRPLIKVITIYEPDPIAWFQNQQRRSKK